MSNFSPKMLRVGIVGAIITAFCCFTPILAVVLSAIGLSAIIGWLDYVLLPALAFFIFLSAYAYLRYRSLPEDK